VWYTSQFYALFFLTITLKVNYLQGYLMVLASLIVATPGFVLFGWLSDRIGRLKIILAGCGIAALPRRPNAGDGERGPTPASRTAKCAR
jgi:MFS family permease